MQLLLFVDLPNNKKKKNRKTETKYSTLKIRHLSYTIGISLAWQNLKQMTSYLDLLGTQSKLYICDLL